MYDSKSTFFWRISKIYNSKMKVTARYTTLGGISISSDDSFSTNTLELCSSSSNPFMIFDHHVMVIDVPRTFLDHLASFDRGLVDVGRSKTYSHIFCWKRFIKNHRTGWKANLLHDPLNIFNDNMKNLCCQVMKMFEDYKKTSLCYNLR